MRISTIVTEAWARVVAAPRTLLAAYLANVALAAPLAAAMYAILRASMGRGEIAERMRQGWSDLWYRGFRADADSFSETFRPSVTGIGAPLHALDDLLTGSLLDLPVGLVAAGVVYASCWAFVSGGLIGRYARPEGHGGFLSESSRAFGRIVAVVAVGWVGFFVVFHYGLQLTGAVADAATHDSVDERVHFAWAVFRYGSVWLVAGAVRVVVDYAKVATVLEPDAGLLGAYRRAVRRIRSRARTVAGLVGVSIVFQGTLLLAYASFAPGIAHPNAFMIVIAWVVSQTFVLGKIAVRCWGLAADTLVFRSQ